MAKKFNLAELMGEAVSKSDTGEMQVEQIPLAEIEENENNSYAQTGIDELADNYLPALTSDLNQAERLLDALYNGSWDDCVKAARSISFDRLKAARKFEDKAFLEQII